MTEKNRKNIMTFMEPKTVSMTLTPAILLRVAAVMEKDGFTEEEVLRVALITGLKKLDPDYGIPSAGKRGRPTVEDRDTATQNRNVELCDALGGRVVMRGNRMMCEYEMFSELAGGVISTATIEEPMENLTLESLDNQYTDILGERGPEAKDRIQRILRAD